MIEQQILDAIERNRLEIVAKTNDPKYKKQDELTQEEKLTQKQDLLDDKLLEVSKLELYIDELQADIMKHRKHMKMLKIEVIELKTDLSKERQIKRIKGANPVGRPRLDPSQYAASTKRLYEKKDKAEANRNKPRPTKADFLRASFDSFAARKYGELVAYAKDHTQEETIEFHKKGLAYSLFFKYNDICNNVLCGHFQTRNPNTGVNEFPSAEQMVYELQAQVDLLIYIKSLDDAVHTQYPFLPQVYATMPFPEVQRWGGENFHIIDRNKEPIIRRWPSLENHAENVINDIIPIGA